MNRSLSGRLPIASRAAGRLSFRPDQAAAPGGFLFCVDGAWTGLAPGNANPAAMSDLSGAGFLYIAYADQTFQKYNYGTPGFTNLTSLPAAISGRGALFGGVPSSKVLGIWSDGAGNAKTVVWHSDAWESPLTPMAVPRTNFAGVADTDGVHIIGGTEDSGAVESTVHALYVQGTDTWSNKAALPVPIGNASGALGPNGDIYLWGSSAGNAVAFVWRKLTNTYEALPAPPWTGGQNDLVVQSLLIGTSIIFLVGGGDNAYFDASLYWTFDPAGAYLALANTPPSGSGHKLASAANFAATSVWEMDALGNFERFDC